LRSLRRQRPLFHRSKNKCGGAAIGTRSVTVFFYEDLG
jgi:hypothetical protein